MRVSVSIGLDGAGHHGVGHMMSNINAQHEAEKRQTALMTFQSNLLRCPALLRALGHPDVAAQIESIDFVKALETGTISGMVRTVNHELEQIRGALES